jgi:hypothetical protein
VTTVVALASAGSFIASVTVSSFITGARWGRMEGTVRSIERDLSEIKGMFTLTLKEK